MLSVFPFMKGDKTKRILEPALRTPTLGEESQLLRPQPPIPDYETRTGLICNINPEVIKAFLMNEPFVRGGDGGGGRGGHWDRGGASPKQDKCLIILGAELTRPPSDRACSVRLRIMQFRDGLRPSSLPLVD